MKKQKKKQTSRFEAVQAVFERGPELLRALGQPSQQQPSLQPGQIVPTTQGQMICILMADGSLKLASCDAYVAAQRVPEERPAAPQRRRGQEPKKHDLKEIAGSGDTIRIGDVFMMVHVDLKMGKEIVGWRDPGVYRLTRVYTEAGDELVKGRGLHFEFIALDGGDRKYPSSAMAGNEGLGSRSWLRRFVRLDQRDVEIWWAAARRGHAEGWHTIDTGCCRGKFRVDAGGEPVELATLKFEYFSNKKPWKRREMTSMKELAKQVGLLTGYKLTLGKGTATRCRIAKAVRKPPPRI